MKDKEIKKIHSVDKLINSAAPLRLDSFGASDIGLVRINNEDVWAYLRSKKFFILADGMGGHQAGEIAANETVLKLCTWIQELFDSTSIPEQVEEFIPLLQRAIKDTNEWVYTLSARDKEMAGMGTTLCLALLVKKTLLYAHVGDSRIYRVRKGRIQRLTVDHSLRDELIANGKLEEQSALSFPFKNIITRAIGTHPCVLPEIQTTEVALKDLYFLCSDGLTDCLTDKEILSIIQEEHEVKTITEKLIEQAKKKGGPDNITIVMFRISSPSEV